jgi:hypothetical protein
MARRREEFYCSVAGQGCGKYFLTYLRDDFSGNYSIQCPGCGHIHYRYIEDGLVSDKRHDERAPNQVDIIIGLLTTLRDTPWSDDPAFRRSQLRAYNGGLDAPN